MAGLCWEVCSLPPHSKVKVRLKTAINALAGARDCLSSTKCSDLVTEETRPPETSARQEAPSLSWSDYCFTRSWWSSGAVQAPPGTRGPERIRAQPTFTQQDCQRATPRIQGTNGLQFRVLPALY